MRWVPLSSPRLRRAPWRRRCLRKARLASFTPVTPAGSLAGPTITKSLYMTSRRSMPSPSATNLSSPALVVHEERVGVAPRPDRPAPGRCRPRPRAPRSRSPAEYRQEVAEQARLLGRGGRGEGDEPLLRAQRAGEHRGDERRGDDNPACDDDSSSAHRGEHKPPHPGDKPLLRLANSPLAHSRGLWRRASDAAAAVDFQHRAGDDPASSEAKNTAALAMSCGCDNRPERDRRDELRALLRRVLAHEVASMRRLAGDRQMSVDADACRARARPPSTSRRRSPRPCCRCTRSSPGAAARRPSTRS